MALSLQFIGCGDAFGSGGRFNTCFHLVGAHLDELRPKRLVLTRMSEDMLNHPDRAAFETADDGKVITIGS
jgi:hypothetical protein